MNDITIPADTARRIAAVLRMHVEAVPPRSPAATQWAALADLLDPPPPSLRDDIREAVCAPLIAGETDRTRIDAVLAVVRRHVEALPVAGAPLAGSDILLRDDVLRLLNGGES